MFHLGNVTLRALPEHGGRATLYASNRADRSFLNSNQPNSNVSSYGIEKGTVAYMARASQLSQVTPNHFTSVKQAGKTFHSRTVTLEPGATKQVALGSYFISDPKPHFEVTTTPASRQEQTGVSLEQINIPGSQKYIVFYHLHNFSDEGCEVTITKQN